MEEPPADPPRRLTVADLLLLRRPTTSASSLHFPSTPASAATSTTPPRKKPKLPNAASSNPTSKPSTAPFAPISHPILLSGTLSPPSADSPAACRSNCFSFSDPSATPSSSSSSSSSVASVCCCLLDFDPAALGREIRVLAWNYLPSVRLHGAAGVLEVVRWCLAEEPAPAPNPAFLATIPLKCEPKDADLAAHGCVFGVVRSVSAVFSMPRAKPDRSGSSVGFLAELICCGCHQCQKSRPKGEQGHNFEAVKFLYFIESASTWRPVLAWLVGKVVHISGLKKQMVSVREKASYTMLVSSTKTEMAWCPSYRVNLPSDCLPENCGGVYAGVITGIFMQGVVVELDNAVWLLTDDQQLPPSHSLRVGAVISVKNFRTISLKLSWTRIVLLAACSKTSITVKSFSVVDSKIYMKAESKSLLGKFVESLDMPARFWILLLISCFKQKFTKLFSDKEILGSQNKQGVVHAYAAKVLSSKGQSQQSLMTVFCSHNCGSSSLGSSLEAWKPVVPLCNFICKAESLWISLMLKFWNGSKAVTKKHGQSQFLCDGISYPGSATRIISSEDLDLVLAGSIKPSPLTGRLQLVDSTGCIDVFIPDLPPTESLYGIYEVSNYKLAFEGPVAYLDHCDVGDPLSCKTLFQQLRYRKRVQHLSIYIIVCWSKLNQFGSLSHFPLPVTNSATSFHLLKLSHMFPANNSIPHYNISRHALYAEAIILPYDLQFTGQAGCTMHAEGFRMLHSCLICNSKASMPKICKIPCSLSFGDTNLYGTLVSSCSCGSGVSVTNEEVLLEFKKGSFFKYPLLRIGGCYLLQCPIGNRTAIEGCGCLKGSKVLLDSLNKLWSLDITIDGNIGIKETTGEQFTEVISAKMDEPFSRSTINDDLKLMQPWRDFCSNSYFHLKFSCEAIGKDMEEYNTLCHVLNGLCAPSSEILSVSSCIEIMTPKEASGSANLQTEEEVQGDLISLQGKVENIHLHGCKEGRYIPGDEKYSICIHVTDNNHTVRLSGYISKHSLLGIGPGAMVTFHRILLTHRHELQLTSVTYIEVMSISHANLNEENVITSSSSKCLNNGSLGTVLPCLFFHRKHFTDNRCMQFHCRVATILMLELDTYRNDLQTPELINPTKGPKINVQLAGFILDDGSSLCCCWADDARAQLMLRLQEVLHLDASAALKLSKDGPSTNLQLTIGSCLEKMLKKQTKVIVRNYGISPDFSCGDLGVSSVSNKVSSPFEEKLLKFIALNACWKGTLRVIASVLNPDDLNGFNVELPDFYPIRNTQMLWINEVFQVDPLQEAWRLYGDLVN